MKYTEPAQEIYYQDFTQLEVELGNGEDGEYWIDLRTYDGEVLISLTGFKTKDEARQALKDKLYKY